MTTYHYSVLIGYDVSAYAADLARIKVEYYSPKHDNLRFFNASDGSVYFGASILEWDAKESFDPTCLDRAKLGDIEEIADLGLIELRHNWDLSDRTYWKLVKEGQKLYIVEEWT